MKFLSIFTLILTVFAFTACDDDGGSGNSQYNGIYEVTTSQERTSCGSGEWNEMTLEEDFFLLEGIDFMGTPVIGWSFCTGQTSDTCDDSFDLMMSFVLEDGEWVQYMDSSSTMGETCWLSRTRGYIEKTDTGVIVTSTTWEGNVTLDAGEECDYELIDKYISELGCGRESVIEADKVN
ncbi:hypothetical protein KKF34_10055 [Myxococcota bacterium]|nr:hypothetical protein [Myxococcota bacterium]MBU1382530.1 hypothetical protein [Myxococcota bacterium]MBU1497209.1 hypothetical protein [Myxococcota bacterium]